MAIDFPDNPANGDVFTSGGRRWEFDGSRWAVVSADAAIGTGTIDASKLAANSVTEAKIASSAVTAGKIGAAAVTEAKLGTGAVTADKIGASSVTETKIASNAVSHSKLASNISAITVCTSSTKPASPFDGQVIYMTDVDQSAVWDGSAWVGLDPSRDRNVVINGAMQIAQRGTSTASITTTGYYTADRYGFSVATMGTWTQSVENDAPTGSGLRKSLKHLCTTADASPAAGDVIILYQGIEGQNLQQFLKGTASAKQWSLSFWVKSNVTGTYIAELYDNDNTRAVSASYTISASATWEKKTITFPADTTGAFDNDNNGSLYLHWYLGAGTTYTSGTLATTWAASTNANRAVGQTNVAAATNNYWQVTGVQLEAGAAATPFEFEDYGTTLAKCQRYYFRLGGDSIYSRVGFGQFSSATVGRGMVPTPTTMRSVPSSIDYSTLATYDQVTLQAITSLALSTQGSSRDMVQFDIAVAANGSQYRWLELVANASTSAYFGASAEL